jgi:hypothetical protein
MGNGSGSMLPPDVRSQMERSTQARRTGGIGSAVHENAAAAAAREQVVNGGAPVTDAPAGVEEESAVELEICPNLRCAIKLEDDWNYCSRCGANLTRGGAAKRLGITWTDDHIQEYIFKGCVVHDLPVLGKHKITVKSSQPTDMNEIDAFMVNGDWQKNPDGSKRAVSEFYVRQMNSVCITAAAIIKFDGASIGDTLADRVKYLMARGSALVDLLNGRVLMFNRALTEHLERADAFLGS